MRNLSVEEITERLNTLQIEQRELTQQLAKHAKKNQTKQDKSDISIGDIIEILTPGVRCKRGDKGVVRKVKSTTIYFDVIKNGHSTYRKRKNIKKIQKYEQ